MSNTPCRPNNRCTGNVKNQPQQMRTVVKCDLRGMPLAMAYVPFQTWSQTYTAAQALCQGTLFPELDLPFECGSGVK